MGINEQMVTELIRHQQEAIDESDNAYWIGEQLLDMVRGNEHAAGILAADLGNKGMGLKDAERKIEQYASRHRKGNRGCCPPPVAERLLREFYGLGEEAPAPLKESSTKLIELEDFF